MILSPQKVGGRECPWDGANCPPLAMECLFFFFGANIPPWAPWEMLHSNQLRGVLSVLKATQNWEARVLFPVLMLNRVAQTNPTYSTTTTESWVGTWG